MLRGRSGYAPSSHGGKAIMDVLDTYPRDELFQASIDELAPVVEKVAHLKERRQVRLFVRREPYGRYLSAWSIFPRSLYDRGSQADGGAAAPQARWSVDRLHGPGLRIGARSVALRGADAHGPIIGRGRRSCAGAELTLATRSWDDEFADVLATWPTPLSGTTPDELSTLVGALPEGYKEDFGPARDAGPHRADGAEAIRRGKDEVNPARRNMVMYIPDRTDDEADLRLKIFAGTHRSRCRRSCRTSRCSAWT